MQIEAIHNITTSQIMGAAIEVHRALGTAFSSPPTCAV